MILFCIKNLPKWTLLIAWLLFTGCAKDDGMCFVDCNSLNSLVVVNESCECDCSIESLILLSGPDWHICQPGSTTLNYYQLILDEYGILPCYEIELMYLQVPNKFDQFTSFFPRPIPWEAVEEESIDVTLFFNKGERPIDSDKLRFRAVTQNGGDRSELIVYSLESLVVVDSEEDIGPIYFPYCEDVIKPARARGYFEEEQVFLEFLFYKDEKSYFDQPDQYLFSETLRFERKYSRNDLEE
ncbi:MAG: hypothetical protein EA409_13880 [Saprospirales bacterium]|nr:MAG: hypothetical protein EA409_13880 [Saprospirales bacterium]